MIHEKQRRILNFWFGEDPLKQLENSRMWFAKDANFDEKVRENFEDLLDEARSGAFVDWPKTADGALALVILCDQFPRQMYRDEERAFECDPVALQAAQIAIDAGLDKKMTVAERVFLYLPFEHSEELIQQDRGVELFKELFESTNDPAERRLVTEALDYAVRHREIIAKFGRFPHRNEALGRSTTREENEFLKRPGSSF